MGSVGEFLACCDVQASPFPLCWSPPCGRLGLSQPRHLVTDSSDLQSENCLRCQRPCLSWFTLPVPTELCHPSVHPTQCLLSPRGVHALYLAVSTPLSPGRQSRCFPSRRVPGPHSCWQSWASMPLNFTSRGSVLHPGTSGLCWVVLPSKALRGLLSVGWLAALLPSLMGTPALLAQSPTYPPTHPPLC